MFLVPFGVAHCGGRVGDLGFVSYECTDDLGDDQSTGATSHPTS
jgi:hypothetical protein